MSDQKSSESIMLRGALVPSFIVGIIAIGISTFIVGLSGFLGALIAQFVVIIYFAIHIGVSRIARNLDPMSTMALAVFSYFAKLLFLGVFLYLLSLYFQRNYKQNQFWCHSNCAHLCLVRRRNCKLYEVAHTFTPT